MIMRKEKDQTETIALIKLYILGQPGQQRLDTAMAVGVNGWCQRWGMETIVS